MKITDAEWNKRKQESWEDKIQRAYKWMISPRSGRESLRLMHKITDTHEEALKLYRDVVDKMCSEDNFK